MGISLGEEMKRRRREPAVDEQPDPSLPLLREIADALDDLPRVLSRVMEFNASTVKQAAAEAAVAAVKALPAPVVHPPQVQVDVTPPDLSAITEAISKISISVSSEDIGQAVAKALQARKTKRVVNRDSWGRIESVTEEPG